MTEHRRWRLWVRFPKEQFEQFEQWSQELGISMSQLIAMCAWTGAKTVIPVLDPPREAVLHLLEKEERQKQMEAQADAYFEEKEEWEEFQKWKQERTLGNNGM